MTEQLDASAARADAGAPTGSLSSMRMAELQALAAQLGLKGTTRMRKSDLVAAIRLLLGYGVLLRVAGDEDSYVSADGDALYDVDRRVLATMLSTVHGPGPPAPWPRRECARPGASAAARRRAVPLPCARVRCGSA